MSSGKAMVVARYYTISSIQVGIGGFLGLIFGITTINSVVNLRATVKPNAAIVSTVLCVLFLSVLTCGIIRQMFVNRYFTYMELLDKRRSYSIDQLAAILEVPSQDVRRDMEKMSEKGFLEYVYIDNKTDRIINTRFEDQIYINPEPEAEEAVTLEPEEEGPETEGSDTVRPESTPGRMIQVVCKNCGAPNKVDSSLVAECMYCGSIIN